MRHGEALSGATRSFNEAHLAIIFGELHLILFNVFITHFEVYIY